MQKIICSYCRTSGQGSVDGITTSYGLDGAGIEPRCGEIFRICPDRSWIPTSLLHNGYRVFQRGKEWSGRDADLSPLTLLVPWSRKIRAIPLLPLWAFVACYRAFSACTRVHLGRTTLMPFVCWELGFESRQAHGCLSLEIGVCCQVERSASGWSPVQRSPTQCGVSS